MYYKVKYRANYEEVHAWLENNCQSEFYTCTDWNSWMVGEKNSMVEFVSESDAVLFALRWA